MGLRTDATLLDIRLKAVGLPVVGVSFEGETPRVELAKTATDTQRRVLAELLASHTDAAAKAVKDDIEMDKPITRREALTLIQQLRDELKEIRNAR